MSISILVGTIGISADFHICQGKVKTFSFFGQAEKCSDMESSFLCENSDHQQVAKKKCCNNEAVYSTASLESVASVASTSHTIASPTLFPIKQTNLVVITPQVCEWQIYNAPPLRQQSSLIIAYQNFLI